MSTGKDLALQLDGTCWNTLYNGIYQTFTFQLIPTFFHNGSIFRLGYFNQCDRWLDNEIISQYQKNSLELKLILDDTYYATYTGGSTMNWKSNSGKIMQWSNTQCFSDTFTSPSSWMVYQP